METCGHLLPTLHCPLFYSVLRYFFHLFSVFSCIHRRPWIYMLKIIWCKWNKEGKIVLWCDQCKLIGDFAVKVRLNNNIFTISLLLYPKTRKEKKIFFIISLNPELTNKGHWKKSCLRKPFINFLSHMILQ